MAAVHFTTITGLANQTKPIGHIERHGLTAVVPYTNSIALVEFQWLTICLSAFILSFRVFARKAL